MKMGIDGWSADDGDELPIEARLARRRLYDEGPLKARPDEDAWDAFVSWSETSTLRL